MVAHLFYEIMSHSAAAQQGKCLYRKGFAGYQSSSLLSPEVNSAKEISWMKTSTSLKNSWNKQWATLSSQDPSSSISRKSRTRGMFSPGTECDLKSQIPQNHKGWQPPDKPDKPPDIQPDKRLNLVEKKTNPPVLPWAKCFLTQRENHWFSG